MRHYKLKLVLLGQAYPKPPHVTNCVFDQFHNTLPQQAQIKMSGLL